MAVGLDVFWKKRSNARVSRKTITEKPVHVSNVFEMLKVSRLFKEYWIDSHLHHILQLLNDRQLSYYFHYEHIAQTMCGIC